MTTINENSVKDVVVVATTANITLSGLQTIDGVSVLSGYRVLVKAQTKAAENGVWVADSGSWFRADDFVGGDLVVTGTRIPVAQGTVNANTQWEVTNAGDIIVGYTGLTFALVLSPAGSVIGTEETSPDGTETFAIDDGGTPKYITIDTLSAFISDESEISETLTASATISSSLRHHFISASTAAVTAELPAPSTSIKDQQHTITPIDTTYTTSVAGSIGGSTATEVLYLGESLSLKCDGTTWRAHG